MSLTIASKAFAHNAEIPRQYTCEGADRSPPLTWSGLAPSTKSLVLIVDDPDAPDVRRFSRRPVVGNSGHGPVVRNTRSHTPEFEHEHVRGSIEKKIAQYGLKHPVMMDNDFSFWNTMGNHYWPAFYLIDKQGRLRAHYAGETHKGDTQARCIESDIEALLAENN